MSYVCEICDKKNVSGNSKTHKRGVAGKRWRKRAQVTKRLFKANLQVATLIEGGVEKKARLCTKCIKKLKKEGKILSFKKKKS